MLGFKKTWEKVRCSWKAAERLPGLVSWFQVVASFDFKDISLWHSKKFSWSSLAEKYHSSSGDGTTVEGASLGEPIYIFIKKNTICSCLCPPTYLQEGAGLWSSCEEVFRPLVACKAGHCMSRAESQSLEQGAKELLSNAPQRQRPPQPGEAARGDGFSKWDLLFKYFLQCTDSWKRGQQAEWKQRNCGGGMRNKGRVSRLWVSKDLRKDKRVKLEKENYRMQEGMWRKYTADIQNWSC